MYILNVNPGAVGKKTAESDVNKSNAVKEEVAPM